MWKHLEQLFDNFGIKSDTVTLVRSEKHFEKIFESIKNDQSSFIFEVEYDNPEENIFTREFELSGDEYDIFLQIEVGGKWNIEKRTHDYPGSISYDVNHVLISQIEIVDNDDGSAMIIREDLLDQIVKYLVSRVDVQ